MLEKFAAYGFQVMVSGDWRIEFNAKNKRERGDVVFHTPKNNLFFVSWGKLEDAQRKFHTVGEQRDETVKRIKRNPNVMEVKMDDDASESIGGHEALLSHVVARGRRGFLSGPARNEEVWSIHLHCPNAMRYYVIYMQVKAPDEYPDFKREFLSAAKSLVCHG